MHRRALLAALTATLATSSGCSGLTDTPQETTDEPRQQRSQEASTPTDLPYSGDGSAQTVEPQGLSIHNQTSDEQYVTVVVEHEDETVFFESGTVSARGDESYEPREYSSIVAAAGIYRVTVETAEGARTVFDWVVFGDDERRSIGANIIVEDDYVWANSRAICDPLCGPVSLDGDAIGTLPYDPTGSASSARATVRRTSTVILTNTSETPREARVRAEFDGETIVDYRYDVRPGLLITVPIATVGGVVDLTLETDGERTQYEWHLPEESYVFSDVAKGVGANCRLPQQYRTDEEQRGVSIGTYRNRSEESQTVTLTVRADGEVSERNLTLDPSTTGGFETDITPEAKNRLSITLETDDGEQAEANWNVCPSKPRSYSIGVDGDGTVALLEWDQPVATSGSWDNDSGATSPTTVTRSPTPTATTTPDDD